MNLIPSHQEPQELNVYLDRGADLVAQGQLEAAKQLYLEALSVISESAEIYQKLGLSCLELEQWQDAAIYYQEAIKLNPQHYWSQCNLGKALTSQNKYEEAVAHYQAAIAIEPEQLVAYRQLGALFLELKKWQEAINILEKAIAIKPEKSWTYYDLGKAYASCKDFDNALRCYQKFTEQEVDFWEGHFRLGEVYQALKYEEEAILSYTKAIDLNPDFGWHYYYLANILSQKSKWQEAVDNYKKAVVNEPKIIEAYQKIGNSLIELQEFSEAVEILEKGLANNPHSYEINYYLGIALARLGQQEEAIEYFSQAISLNTTFTRAYTELIAILIDLQKWSEAEKWLYRGNSNCLENLELLDEQAKRIKQISLDRNLAEDFISQEKTINHSSIKTKDTVRAKEKLELADIFANRGDWEQAATTYAAAIEFNPDNSWYYCCYAIALQEGKKYELAINTYKKAIELDGNSPWYHKCLGGLYFQQQQWQLAIDCYQRALTLTDDFWYCENLGVALCNLERWTEAEPYLKKGLKLHPYNREIQDQLAKSLLQQSKWEEAKAFAEDGIELLPDYLELYDNAIVALEKLGQQEKANKVAEQQKIYQTIVSLKEKIKLEPKQIDCYQNLAKAFEKLNQWEVVVSIYRLATQISSDCPWWLYASLGEALLKVGQYSEAESAYRHSVTINHSSYSPWLIEGFATVLFKLGKWSEVVTLYSQNETISFESPKSYDYWGVALIKLQQNARAITIYQQAIDKFPQKTWWQAKFYDRLGEIYFDCQNWHAAEQAYLKSESINSNEFQHYEALGDTLFAQDRWEEAVTYYQKDLAANPNLSWSSKLYSVAWSYHQLSDRLEQEGNLTKAAEASRKAISLSPDLPWHHLQLARILAKQNCWQEAYQVKEQGFQSIGNYNQQLPPLSEIDKQVSGHSLIICIYSCEQNLHKQQIIRSTWLKQLEKHQVPYYFVVGKPSAESYIDKDILYVNAPDDYQHLSQKTYQLFEYIYNNTFYSRVMKVDDDCYLNVPALLDSDFTKQDYTGKAVIDSKKLLQSRYQEKISSVGKYIGQENVTWAEGSAGYILNRYAIEKILTYPNKEQISGELYEDKLVGDILRDSQIDPVCPPKYITGIEKCDLSTAYKLAFQAGDESNYPHRDNDVVVFHSDNSSSLFPTIDSQFESSKKSIDKQLLRNFYWQKDPQEAHICLERKDDKTIDLAADDILCFLVERNESLRLPYILSYYRAKGVNKFFVVDNHSTDETLTYLLGQPDVYVWHTSRSYAGSKWGVDWVEILLKNYAFNHWCVLVDADELLYYPDCETKDIRQLCQELDRNGEDALSTVLLDMYSRKPLREANYQPGQNFLEVCSYFDKKFYTANALHGGPEKNITAYFGGLRQRIFGGKSNSFCINKAPLIKYHHNIRLYEGFHWIGNVKLASQTGCLLHFKYFSTFHEYAKQEAQRGEHWNGGSEYMKYAKKLTENPQLSFWDTNLSVELENSQTLEYFGAIKRG